MDLELFFWLNDFAGRSSFVDWLVIFLGEYSAYLLILFFLVWLFLSGFSKLEKKKIFWFALISTLVARFGITSLIRFYYHKPRPFLSYSVNQLISESDYSFPSGHATFFFALAMAIYFFDKKMGIWFLVASVAMGIARIIAGVHYPIDILGGAIIGIITAVIIMKLFNNRKTLQF